MLTKQLVEKYFIYTPEDGRFFNKISKRYSEINHNSGYYQINIQEKSYLAHRLAWLCFYGNMPNGVIDHIDGNKKNNAISNLRDVDQSVNCQNAKISKANRSGIKGVGWNKKHKCWIARVYSKGVTHSVFGLKTLEEAAIAVRDLRIKVHGEFARHE